MRRGTLSILKEELRNSKDGEYPASHHEQPITLVFVGIFSGSSRWPPRGKAFRGMKFGKTKGSTDTF